MQWRQSDTWTTDHRPQLATLSPVARCLGWCRRLNGATVTAGWVCWTTNDSHAENGLDCRYLSSRSAWLNSCSTPSSTVVVRAASIGVRPPLWQLVSLLPLNWFRLAFSIAVVWLIAPTLLTMQSSSNCTVGDGGRPRRRLFPTADINVVRNSKTAVNRIIIVAQPRTGANRNRPPFSAFCPAVVTVVDNKNLRREWD